MTFASLMQGAAILALMAAPVAAEVTLRIRTHSALQTVSGKLAAQFTEDAQTMSGGGIKIEMFASSSVVATVETFQAAANGIRDCDMASNKDPGLDAISMHATCPGFRSMPSDHLACNKPVWDGLSDAQHRIIDTAMQKLPLQPALTFERAEIDTIRRTTETG